MKKAIKKYFSKDAIRLMRFKNLVVNRILSIKNVFNSKAIHNKDLISSYNKARPFGPQKYLCFAPYKSLYFGTDGNVIACCYNRKHILGNYPSETLNDIWIGKALNKLRKSIENNDLSLGCHGCLDQLNDGNFGAILSINYDKIPFNKNFPTLMEFELNTTCNLECIMCDERFSSCISNRKGLSLQKMVYDDNFVEQLKAFIPYLYEAKFLGGEPFLIPIYYKIWEQIIDINPECRIIVQTNATVLSDKAKVLIEKGNFQFNISIDSFNKETYENIRKNASYEDTMNNFEYLYDYCKRKGSFFGISVCAIQQNRLELAEIVKFGNDRDFTVYFNRVWTPAECALWKWNTEKLLETYDFLKTFTLTGKSEIQQKNIHHFNELLQQIHTWYIEAKSEER